MTHLLSIPSPAEGVWHLGPIPIRAYALCIIAGVVAAVWLGNKRWIARGGRAGEVADIAIWAVPFGLVGGRLYHVITDSDLYFGKGNQYGAVGTLEIWHGGLGIWGAIALGGVGAYIGARQAGVRMPPLADALAPGLLLAQAIGRWGNYFNQELYGRPTKLPWGLEISPQHWPEGRSFPAGTTFHPTFLYECLWNLAVMALIIWLDRRYRLGHGRVFALYVMGYTAGRGWIESLRIDTIELHDVLGFRWGVWMSIILFVGAAVYFVYVTRTRPGREESVYREGREPGAAEPSDGAATHADRDEPAEVADVADDTGRPRDLST